MSENLKKEIIKGSFWSVFGQLITLIISFVSNIILARILSPNEFGQIGIIMFFLTIMSVISESGLGGALVRNKDATLKDYSTVFVTNLVFSIILYLFIVLLSQPIANYYHDTDLHQLLIVTSLVILINAFQISQNAKLVSNLRFKQKYIYKFFSTLLSSIIGIVLALQGYGVWSLVVLQIANALLYTVFLWAFEGTYLSFAFSLESFKRMSSFGINTTLSSVLNSIFDNVYQLILAKYFSINQTGNYYQAKRLQDVPGGVLNVVTQGVVFSSLAKLQDDKKQFIQLYNTICKYFSIILGAISLIIYSYAEPIILLIFGEKWIGSVYFMQMLTIASFFYMQESFNRVIFKVYDRTKFILILDFIKKIVQTISIIVGIVTKSLDILIIGFVISSAVGYFINFYISRKVLGNVNLYELVVLFKIIVSIVLVCIIVNFVNNNLDISVLQKLLTIPISGIIFLCLLILLRVVKIDELNRLKRIK